MSVRGDWYRSAIAVGLALVVVVSAAAGPAIAVGTTEGTGTEPTNAGQASSAGSGATPTFVEENVTSDTTWTASEGPYRVIKSVTVEEGATLTIEPGTTVQVSDGVTVTVRGGLVTEGTADEPVNITSGATEPQPGAWGTLRLNTTTASELTLEHTRVSYATNGLTVSEGDTRVTFDGGAVLHSSKTGILFRDTPRRDGDAPPLTVRGVNVSANRGAGIELSATAGIYGFDNVSDWTIRNSTFRSDGRIAIGMSALGRVERITIAGNEFSDYNQALRIKGALSDRIEQVRIADNEFRGGREQVPVVEFLGSGVRSVTFADNHIVDNEGDAVVIDGFRETHHLTFVGNRIARSDAGIQVKFNNGDTTNDLRALAFRNNEVVNTSGYGIRLKSERNLHNLSLSGDTVRRNDRVGISISAADSLRRATVADAVVAENAEDGLTLVAGNNMTDVTVEDSRIVANGGDRGLLLRAFRFGNVRVTGNRVLENRRNGIDIRSDRRNVGPVRLEENVIAANRYGVFLRDTVEVGDNRGGPRVTLVRNTIAFNYHNDRRYRSPGDAGLRIGARSTNNTARRNDIYGNVRGATTTGGTIDAANNYWGAASGPYHESANPQGEGNRVVGAVEKIDFVPFLEERVGTHEELQKPTARFASDRVRGYATRAVTVSAEPSGDPDGSVESYVFWVESRGRDDGVRSTDPRASFTFDHEGTYNVSLVVEDDTGIDSNVTTIPVVVTEGTPTPEATPTPSPTASPTPEPEGDGGTPTDSPASDGDDGAGDGSGDGSDGAGDGDGGTDTAGGSGPGFGPALTVLAVVVALLLRRR